LAVFKYSDGPLIPAHVRQIYLHNNTWEIGKNAYGEAAMLGDIKTTLPQLNTLIKQNPPAGVAERNEALQKKAEERRTKWKQYLEKAQQQEKIWAVVVADALRELIEEYGLEKKFVYVHEAVSDPAPFQFLLPFHEPYAAPASYYCVGGGSLGWSMPATLGIKLASSHDDGDINPELVINAVGDGSSLFYPQTYWTAAHRRIPILYIIMNNREYHTLQLGLGQVVAAYGNQEGYRWKPKTMTPEYLTIENPNFDFVSLARAFGIANGRVVENPGEVKDALREGIENVLKNAQSHVIDMRIEQQTPAPPAVMAMAHGAKATEELSSQPLLNVFYEDELARANEESGQLTSTPVIF
jgi:benzoylformate decarboxylase